MTPLPWSDAVYDKSNVEVVSEVGKEFADDVGLMLSMKLAVIVPEPLMVAVVEAVVELVKLMLSMVDQ